MGVEKGRRSLTLEGVRVLDLTSMWAGPLCTRVLADLGGEVIKIEAPTRPDGTRQNPPYFEWLNRNKLGITLDLNVESARQCFKRLVAMSQVVVENFSPRVMVNFGLAYPALRDIRPDIIMLSMPAYGSTGPYANYTAYGPGLEAASGLAALTGYREGPPMLSGLAYGDPVAGMHGAVAVLAALRYWRRFGKGQWIDLSQREALSQMFGEAFLKAAKGMAEPRSGNRHPTMAPHGCYRCRGHDQWISITVGSDAEWRRLCRVVGKDELAEDPSFADTRARKSNEDRLDQELESWTRQRDCQEAMKLLQEAHVAACVVKTVRDLVADPHLTARGFFKKVADFDGQVRFFPGLPWKMTSMDGSVRRRAPRLGEHNSQVLEGLLDDIRDSTL